jgi:NADPH:quinone reductase-like Zn-dependent oxidoreductase
MVSPPPPLTLGSDISGVVEDVGPDVSEFKIRDEVYGVTNKQFCGANADYALASADMMARKPQHLSHVEAASVPVVAVTAWQMLFDHAKAVAGQTVLILGAAGNVGAYAVQFAASAGLDVIAVVGSNDVDYVRNLGARTVQDYQSREPGVGIRPVDVVVDTVGGETRERSFRLLKPDGILVSVVSPEPSPGRPGVRSVFFYVEVTTVRLNTLNTLLESGKISPRVGSVLPLRETRVAHEMLGGAPHKRGKIVLEMAI